MKKIFLLLFIVFILFGCSAKKDDLYQLSFHNQIITVGYNSDELVKGMDEIEEYQSILNIKKEYILSSITLYFNDEEVLINNYSLSNGLKDTCSHFNGTIVNNNGTSCVIQNRVKKKDNVIILYTDILSDNTDQIDRVKISYQ